VSLRREVHSAIDGIAPSTFGMPERVVQTVLHDAKRRRKEKLMLRVRARLSPVAVLLLIALVAAVLVGGRVWYDWSVFTNRPVPAGQINAEQLAALEARPLHIPLVPPDATCPVGPNLSASDAASFPEPIHSWARAGFQFSGGGPAYATKDAGAVGGGISGWGVYAAVVWLIKPQVTGLVLIRGRDAANHDLPLVYVGQYAAGSVLGTDTVNGKQVLQRAELVLNASHHPASSGKSTWGVYEVIAGIPGTMSGCHAFQVDGEGFSEVFLTQPG
jgi:hypothetical protein